MHKMQSYFVEINKKKMATLSFCSFVLGPIYRNLIFFMSPSRLHAIVEKSLNFYCTIYLSNIYFGLSRIYMETLLEANHSYSCGLPLFFPTDSYP